MATPPAVRRWTHVTPPQARPSTVKKSHAVTLRSRGPAACPGVPVSLSVCHYHVLSREPTAHMITSLARVRARSQPGIAPGYDLGT